MSEEKKQPPDDNIGNTDTMVEHDYDDREMPVPLTEQERLAIGEELAQAQNEAELMEGKKKSLVEEYNGSITDFYNKVSELARRLRHGKTMKPVQCRTTKDYRLGWIKTIRMDDHTEVLSRPMTNDERQTGLSFH